MKVFNTDERVKRIADRMANDSSAVDLVRKYIEMRDSIPMVDVSPTANIAVSPERSVEVAEPMVSVPEQTGLAGYVPGDEEYVPFVPAFVPEGTDLFSDEAKARRRLKQMYAESGFRKNAVSKAGARGLFQIMPVTERDYVKRGKGKSGDVFDPEYNERIRDYVFSAIPKDLGKYWSEDDSDENKLAKLYAAYNWGVGNLRSYLRKKSESGVDISDPENWVGGLNPETRNYVTFLAMDKDVDGTALTNSAFENAARKRGYMAEGGRLFEDGGPEKTYQDYLDEYRSAKAALGEAKKNEQAAKTALRDFRQGYTGPDGNWSPYWYWTPEGKRLDAESNIADKKLEEARNAYFSASDNIGNATLEKYRGTSSDPMAFWEGIATTKEGAEKYFRENAIRESAGAQEVADYFKSYANSPGYARIRNNQEQWWKQRHPYKKIYEGTGKAMGYTDSLRGGIQVSPYGVFDLSVTPQISKMRTRPKAGMITVGTNEEKDWPYWFVLPHEMAHIANTFGVPYFSAQAEALSRNTNTSPGHDSELEEKHSDKEALMFLLYKEGIYDSRGEKDCTPEDIAKLRKKYPDLRPLQQMDDEKAAWMINHVADAGNQESMYDNHLGNISANGGNLFRAGGPGSITGVSPVNMLVPFVDKTIEKITEGDTAKKIANWYHNHADKIPPRLHRAIYNTIKESAFGNDALPELKYNFIPNLLEDIKYSEYGGMGSADNVFLMSPEQQKSQLESLGWKQVDTSGGYGLVNSAVQKYKSATGRDVPMYQVGDDEISREQLVPVGDFTYHPILNYTWVIDEQDPETGFVYSQHTEDKLKSRGDTAHAPGRYYRDMDGNLYFKEWDFFDHGDYSRGNYSDDIRGGYVTRSLTDMSERYGNILDMAGNPFVKTTGYTKLTDDAQVIDNALREIIGYDSYDNEYGGDAQSALDAIKSGKYDVKASGGKIHIKPENRGKFNALLKRTGKSASWFKEHGTPLQRKRATFALNAKKWKHDEGGEIERDPDNFAVRDNTYVSSLIPRGFGFNPAEERPLPPSLGQARWDDGITGAFPFIGDGLQGLQAIRDFRQGDPVTGFQTAGLLLIPNIAEKAVRGLFRKSTALSALDDVASGSPPTLLEKMRKLRERADAERVLAGDIPHPTRTVLSPEELGVEKDIPQEVKERFYSSSMERMQRQRPETNAKELGHKFGDVTNRTYREYPQSTFDKAGAGHSTGRHYDSGHIAVSESSKDVGKTLGHELRHELDWQVPLTENEKSILTDAYGDDFINTGRSGKSPKILKREEVTTNFDARNMLLGDKVSLSVDEQNALIDAATPKEIGTAVYKANGYGSSFIKKLVDEKKWTTARVNKIKEAMKTVGAVSGAAAVSRALYNDEELPVQLSDGGLIDRYSPEQIRAAIAKLKETKK